MKSQLSIALVQINPTVGDVTGNAEKILSFRDKAHNLGAEIVIFGELSLSGYPAEDLVLKSAFQNTVKNTINNLAKKTKDGGPAIIVGAPWILEEKLYNALLVLDAGKVKAIRRKHELPNYGVFDEKRVFSEGPLPGPVEVRGVRLGLMICEDMWFPDLTECLEESGAEILIVANGSPFETDKLEERINYAVARVTESKLPLIYVNLIGGQDELVFDGASFVLNSQCNLRARAPCWQSSLIITNWNKSPIGWDCNEGDIAPVDSIIPATYNAMMVGLRDYVNKNNFPGVILGLSGGVDSALSVAVAVDALGSNRVHCVMMPSPYTSKDSIEDASLCAKILDLKLQCIPINSMMTQFEKTLNPLFNKLKRDITEENIQSRIRGTLLMAISNKLKYMVLTTGNKSEMSVGYSTLYGDMCGGYSVLKDVYKTEVYKLCRWRNMNKPLNGYGPQKAIIPERIITKPASAELKPNQQDTDTLPPYDILDAILVCLIEQELSVEATMKLGFDSETVKYIWRLLDLAEYKRRQAPPGVKLTRQAFGRDRRYPITNAFKGQI